MGALTSHLCPTPTPVSLCCCALIITPSRVLKNISPEEQTSVHETQLPEGSLFTWQPPGPFV